MPRAGPASRVYIFPTASLKSSTYPYPRAQKGAFVHIGYCDPASPRNIYGHLGPVIPAERLEKTVADLKAQRVAGVMTYAEGVFNDVNKALFAGLSSGKFQTADEVLRPHAKRYFGVNDKLAARCARWLKARGKPYQVDTEQSAISLAELMTTSHEGGWRRRQWELRQRPFELNHAIGAGNA